MYLTKNVQTATNINFGNVVEVKLDVSKTASTSFTRTYEWSISKSATPTIWDIFKGDILVVRRFKILLNVDDLYSLVREV